MRETCVVKRRGKTRHPIQCFSRNWTQSDKIFFALPRYRRTKKKLLKLIEFEFSCSFSASLNLWMTSGGNGKRGEWDDDVDACLPVSLQASMLTKDERKTSDNFSLGKSRHWDIETLDERNDAGSSTDTGHTYRHIHSINVFDAGLFDWASWTTAEKKKFARSVFVSFTRVFTNRRQPYLQESNQMHDIGSILKPIEIVMCFACAWHKYTSQRTRRNKGAKKKNKSKMGKLVCSTLVSIGDAPNSIVARCKYLNCNTKCQKM